MIAICRNLTHYSVYLMPYDPAHTGPAAASSQL